MKELLDKQDVLDAIYAKMEKTDKPDVVLGLAAAMSVVKKMEGTEQEPCEDAISRQAAIDATCADCSYDNCRYRDNGVKHASCGYVDRLKRLPPVKPESKWIPVSERLPEKNDVYLVAINSYGCPTRDVDGFVSQSVRKWEMYGKSVVAWMPLPEPYKASPTGVEVEE